MQSRDPTSLFYKKSKLNAEYQYMRDLLDALWGPAGCYEETVEEKAGLFAKLYYTWITPYIQAAAEETLDAEGMPPPEQALRAYKIGKALSEKVQNDLYCRHAWDPYIGSAVTHIKDDALGGVLRWVGYVQQPLKKKQARWLMAGVEWHRTPPASLLPNGSNDIHDGIVHGEHLFEPQRSDVSSCLPASHLQLASPFWKDHERSMAAGPPRAPSVLWSLFSVHAKHIYLQVPPKLVGDCLTLSMPVVLGWLIGYLEQAEHTWGEGLLYAFGLFVMSVAQSCALHKFYDISIRGGIVLRGALFSVLYEKCLTISSRSLTHPEMNVGRVMNMVNTDVERPNDFCQYAMYMWSSPLQLLTALALLYHFVGVAAFAGVFIIVISLPLQTKVMQRLYRARKQLAQATDNRVKVTNELFSGIRIVKFMGWEPKFLAAVDDRRDVELQYVRTVQWCRIISSGINVAMPPLTIAAVFLVCTLLGHELTPTIVFPVIGLLTVLRLPFVLVPMILTTTLEMLVSLRRIDRFLECDNRISPVLAIEAYVTGHQAPAPTSPREQDGSELPAGNDDDEDDSAVPLCEYAAILESCSVSALIPVKLPVLDRSHSGGDGHEAGFLANVARQLCRCQFCGKKKKHMPGASSPVTGSSSREATKTPTEEFFELRPKVLLRDMNIRIPKGQLTVVIGPTGCGKSTFINVLLGQLEITQGRAWASKSVAYVAQQPWIMNATVRENILLFSDYEATLFEKSIQASQLSLDLDLLSNGLETEIGEKGINLSGGQKTRVSLARAIYADRDIYLLDDPLSALDAHVGERILQDCLLGCLQAKTRVLATHHIHVLPYADHIIALDAHGVAFEGSYDLFQRSHISQQMALALAPEEGEPATPSTDRADHHAAPGETSPEGTNASAQSTTTSSSANPKAPTTASALMSTEEKASGSVPMSTYAAYFRACGGYVGIALILVVFLVTEAVNMMPSVWLALWAADREGHTSSLKRLLLYLLLVLLGVLSAPCRYSITFRAARQGSRLLHQAVLRAVATGTMTFFDTTPLGRILNRFARDIDRIDNDLPMSMIFFLQNFCSIVSVLCLSVFAQPYVLLVLFPCTYLYYRILTFYNAANREVRRISSVVKSPLISLVSESLTGAATIAAYGKSHLLMQKALRQLDIIYACSYMENTGNRWLGVRVELVSNVITTGVALGGVVTVMHQAGAGTANTLVPLSITMALQMTSMLNWFVRQSAAVEAEMNSMERLQYYIDHCDQEAQPELPDLIEDMKAQQQAIAADGTKRHTAIRLNRILEEHTPDTPAGTLEFQQVDLRYRDGLPLVLDGVSFRIRAGQKVGIVGRTGSGKSTLLLTFLRMVDICGGEILVNGRAIRSFSLRELRRQFAMIPQDPLLFEGTVQSNLDPFEESSSGEVWRALELVGMRERIESEAGGLEGRVLEGGSNFSVGQRQLLCLARALLKKQSGFILMDEATANIDPALDRQIQDTVASAFAAKTVITIAHRLHTVAQYDMIIVMDKGRVAEIGSPRELGLKPSGVFRKMVEAQGAKESKKFLRSIGL